MLTETKTTFLSEYEEEKNEKRKKKKKTEFSRKWI